jgi:8-oxo-dGTP diphosphatase
VSLDGHPKPAVTADVVCVTHTNDGDPSVLLIRRSNDPFRDHWAVPGGFVAADETIEQAAARELREKKPTSTSTTQRSWNCSECGLGPDVIRAAG